MKYEYKLLKIGDIAGMYYYSDDLSTTLVVYGIGAPIPPDYGWLPDAKEIMKFKTDIFIPDYIGYGRSDGKFTPLNCIRTFIKLYKSFINGCIGVNYYDNSKKKLKYDRIIFIGRSFGGTYVPLLPRFEPAIKLLGLFCPVVNSKSCGSVTGEESNEDFLRSMKKDGYHHLYRGILSNEWKEHLENKDDLSPMDNIRFLSKAKLFIAHGKLDKCVHYSKSVEYYEKIKQSFPKSKNDYCLKLYPNGNHGKSTTNNASVELLEWIGIERRK